MTTKKNPAAVALGRLGGKKGGKARAEVLSPEKRSEIARNAGIEGAKVRWGKKVKGKKSTSTSLKTKGGV